MKILLYNINPILAFELRHLGEFDFYVNGSSLWNYNVRPRPKNIEEVVEFDPSKYKCVVSEDFTGFAHDIKRVQALDIPYLSVDHYSYIKKSSTDFISGGHYLFTNESEIKFFVKVVANQNVSFIGSKIAVCKNIELPTVQQLSTLGDLDRVSTNRYYTYLNVLGSHTGYVNVIKNNYSVYEAMLLGLPVVSVKTDPAFKHGVCGLFSDDPYELRSYLKHLIEHPDIALKMGANAKRYLEHRFANSQFHKEWKKVLA